MCERANDFARRQPASGMPTVPVVQELVKRLESLQPTDKPEEEEQQVGHVGHDDTELELYDALEVSDHVSHDSSNDIANKFDSSSATNFIRSVMHGNNDERVHAVAVKFSVMIFGRTG